MYDLGRDLWHKRILWIYAVGHKSDKHEFGIGFCISTHNVHNLLDFEPVNERIWNLNITIWHWYHTCPNWRKDEVAKEEFYTWQTFAMFLMLYWGWQGSTISTSGDGGRSQARDCENYKKLLQTQRQLNESREGSTADLEEKHRSRHPTSGQRQCHCDSQHCGLQIDDQLPFWGSVL